MTGWGSTGEPGVNRYRRVGGSVAGQAVPLESDGPDGAILHERAVNDDEPSGGCLLYTSDVYKRQAM